MIVLRMHLNFNYIYDELFPEHRVCKIGGRRIKCIRFANDLALLAGHERMLKNMLMELNDVRIMG